MDRFLIIQGKKVRKSFLFLRQVSLMHPLKRTLIRPLVKGYHDEGNTQSISTSLIMTCFPTFSKLIFLSFELPDCSETYSVDAQGSNFSVLKVSGNSETMTFHAFFIQYYHDMGRKITLTCNVIMTKSFSYKCQDKMG